MLRTRGVSDPPTMLSPSPPLSLFNSTLLSSSTFFSSTLEMGMMQRSMITISNIFTTIISTMDDRKVNDPPFSPPPSSALFLPGWNWQPWLDWDQLLPGRRKLSLNPHCTVSTQLTLLSILSIFTVNYQCGILSVRMIMRWF